MVAAACHRVLASLVVVSAGQTLSSPSLSPSSRNDPSTVTVSRAEESGCLETKCHGGVALLALNDPVHFDDLCWTGDALDATNCVDGYEPTLLTDDDVTPFPPYDENWSYFTCCPPGYEAAIERQCDSRACSGIGGRCFVVHGEESKYPHSIPIVCNDDQFRFPNAVAIERAYMIYSCCKTDDGSVEKYKAMDLECTIAACADWSGNCTVWKSDNFPIPLIESMA